MQISKRTLWNLVLIVFVLSFFVTPLGFQAKVILNQIFASSPNLYTSETASSIEDYQWKLKDGNGKPFSFEEAQGKVVFINFWASWRLPCIAELKSIQKMYHRYKDDMQFYIITNEEREPVQIFMEEYGFDFPVTYLIIGEKAPFTIPEAPASYIIDREGRIRSFTQGIAKWNTKEVYDFLDGLLE